MNEKVHRNWKKLEGEDLSDEHDDSKTLYVNRHTGVCVSVWHEGEYGSTHCEWQAGNWNVCLPSGFSCQSFETEQQAISFLKNWMIQNPAGRSDVKYNKADKERVFEWLAEEGVNA